MGPLSKGDWMTNLRKIIDMAEDVRKVGHTPFLPHLTMFWHLVHPHDYEYWMSWDEEWLRVCDAAIRLPGESPGSEREITVCKSIQIPIFISVKEFIEWNSIYTNMKRNLK